MEPLERLRATISGFPGYDSYVDRRRSDEYVRSYLGERLTEMPRSDLEPQVVARIEALMLRVAFADPRDFKSHDTVATSESTDGGAVALADAATLDLADRAADIDPASASEYLEEVTAALDRRDEALRAVALKTL